eukprot:TRINITY_DN3447_c0_g1_i1.p1 TRINITY_DN3447_c0_g1~~TRINITY_DN3447_c0_g1_i1.p1  ORF type:complete len:826 (+),score=163.75 TRINITY_DN3447_c0_g1_i1:42-2519(+)
MLTVAQVIVLSIVLLSSCYALPGVNDTDIIIGAAMPFSFPDYAIISASSNVSWTMWLENVNLKGGIKVGNKTYTVKLIILDCGHPNNTIMENMTKNIYTDYATGVYGRIDFLFAPYSSGLTTIAALVAEKYQMIMVSGHAATSTVFRCPSTITSAFKDCTGRPNNRRFEYTVGLLPPANLYYGPFVSLSRINGAKTIAVFYESNSFTKGLAEGVNNSAVQVGIKVVYSKVVQNATAQGVAPILEEIRLLDPDVIAGCTYDILCRESISYLKKINYSPKGALAMTICMGRQLITDLGDMSHYVSGPVGWDPRLRGTDYTETANSPIYHWYDNISTPSASLFNLSYVAHPLAKYYNYTEVPNYQASSAYVMGYVIHEILYQSQSFVLETLVQKLHEVRFPSFFGAIALDNAGQNFAKEFGTNQITQKDTIEIITPLSSATIESVYPLPEWSLRNPNTDTWGRTVGEKVTFIITIALIILVVCVGIVFYIWREKPQISASSIVFCETMFFGTILVYISILLWGEWSTDSLCDAQVWVFMFGLDISMGSLLFKNWRIYRIFKEVKSLRNVKISNIHLFLAIATLCAVDVVILIAWELTDGIHVIHIIPYIFEPANDYYQCNGSITFISILGVTKGLLILGGILLTYLLRKVASAFNESKYIGYAMYNYAFCIILLLLVWLALPATNHTLIFGLRCVIVLWGVTVSFGCLALPKLYYAHTGKKDPVSSISSEPRSNSHFSVDSTKMTLLETKVMDLEDENDRLKKKISELQSKSPTSSSENQPKNNRKSKDMTEQPIVGLNNNNNNDRHNQIMDVEKEYLNEKTETSSTS